MVAVRVPSDKVADWDGSAVVEEEAAAVTDLPRVDVVDLDVDANDALTRIVAVVDGGMVNDPEPDNESVLELDITKVDVDESERGVSVKESEAVCVTVFTPPV